MPRRELTHQCEIEKEVVKNDFTILDKHLLEGHKRKRLMKLEMIISLEKTTGVKRHLSLPWAIKT